MGRPLADQAEFSGLLSGSLAGGWCRLILTPIEARDGIEGSGGGSEGLKDAGHAGMNFFKAEFQQHGRGEAVVLTDEDNESGCRFLLSEEINLGQVVLID